MDSFDTHIDQFLVIKKGLYGNIRPNESDQLITWSALSDFFLLETTRNTMQMTVRPYQIRRILDIILTGIFDFVGRCFLVSGLFFGWFIRWRVAVKRFIGNKTWF